MQRANTGGGPTRAEALQDRVESVWRGVTTVADDPVARAMCAARVACAQVPKKPLTQRATTMPPPEPSLLADTYSAAVLTLWGDKDEEATKTWMGRHARSLLSVPSPNEHERLAFVLFF